jgi:hypothetical protein
MMAKDEILYLGIKRDYDKRVWVISEEHVKFYRVLGMYTRLSEAARDLGIIRKKPRYAHLDENGFAPETLP